MKASRNGSLRAAQQQAFTVIELMVVLSVTVLVGLMLLPALAKSNGSSKSFQCLNNHRRLMVAWKLYEHDFNDKLVAATAMPNRPAWISGNLDFSGSNPSNWDTNRDIVKSPLWPYVGNNATIFRCPADQSGFVVAGTPQSRVRSYSLSSVFAHGEWLTGSYDPNQTVWRTYGRGSEVMIPGNAFTFADEHPDSINDGQLATACTGNQPQDLPGAARIIDFPASWHTGGCTFSFADGRAEIHEWVSNQMKAPMKYTGTIFLNTSLPQAYLDLHWLAANTTVRQ